MRLLDTLERRFHWLVIPQFPLFIVTANGLIFLLAQFKPVFVNQLMLDPIAVRAGGEWWRLVTFLFIPNLSTNPIFFIFWLLFLYQMAQALESAWGEFRFFIFYIGGALATILGAVLLSRSLGNDYLNATLFLAYATLFPDFELLIFPLPFGIKVKYLGWIVWVWLAFRCLLGSLTVWVAVAAALFNYFLFFGFDLWRGLQLRISVYRNRSRFKP